MAVAYLFGDCSLARQHPDTVVTLESVLDRLVEGEFRVGKGTDYLELKSRVFLLDAALDDGSHPVGADAEEDKAFNASIDEMANQLGRMWRNINDTGATYSSRTEAKSIMEWVQQRLTYSVRTRPPAKKSIFDDPAPRNDTSLPRQQKYMQSFFKKPAAVPP